jgi:hypothetical protein
MPRAKTIILALATTATLCATLASSAASAAEWFIEGAKLPAGQSAAVASTASVDEATTFSVPSLKIKVSCAGPLLLREGILHNQGTYLLREHVWHTCAVTQPATGCSLTSSDISTTPLVGTVTASTSPQDRVTFAPQTKRTLAVLSFNEANTCALNSEVPVTGSFTQNLPTGQTEKVTQAFTGLGSIENNSLEIAGSKVFIEGGLALVKLASGSKWSFH